MSQQNEAIQPINIILKNKILKDSRVKYLPRKYQEQLFQEALKRNVIIYLGTGLGKTFISVLYLNWPEVYNLIQRGRKAVFLAPTQDLIKQQATYINAQVPYRVKIFCGRTAHCGEHIDNWNEMVWTKELELVDVLFMTPQTLVNATSTSLLKWQQFSVIFFDECHHAARAKSVSNSQYSQLLSHHNKFYSMNPNLPKPRLIGLTASLINTKPKDRQAIKNQIANLSSDFRAICVTDPDAQKDLPRMIIHSFRNLTSFETMDTITSIFSKAIDRMEEALKTRDEEKARKRGTSITKKQSEVLSFLNRLKLAAAGFSIKPSSFPKVMRGLLNVHHRCSLWAFMSIIERLISAMKNHSRSNSITDRVRPMYIAFTNMLNIIHKTIYEFLNMDRQFERQFVRPRPMALLDILTKEYERMNQNQSETFSCIVFVTSRLEVVALNCWLQHVSKNYERYSFIKPDYAIGLASTMASKYACITKRKPSEQQAMLNKFRNGELNVIITTAVLEEGIDLPTCSTVIRYDNPKNYREYVQSRGRARQKMSSFYFMSIDECSERTKTDNFIRSMHDIECSIKDILSLDYPPTKQPTSSGADDMQQLMKEDVFIAKNGAIHMSGSMCRTLLHMYLCSLAAGAPFPGDYEYERKCPKEGHFQTTLYFPSACPIRDPAVGNVKLDQALADNSAAVAGIMKLYENGELDENGIPIARSARTVTELLEEKNLKTKFEQLDEELEGYPLNDGTEFKLYKQRIFNPTNSLAKEFTSKRYKFLKLKLITDTTKSRLETAPFFENPSFGLITDKDLNTAILPNYLYGHYGEMEVQYEILDENYILRHRAEHTSYMDYTCKLFKNYLSVGPVNFSSFYERCLCYVVPLDKDDQPDRERVRKSFQNARNTFKPCQIVRLNQYYSRMSRGPVRFMMVRNIRHDMNVHSIVPGFRRTFIQKAREDFGPNVVHNQNQKVIELMPVSNSYAELRRLKRRGADHSTQSVFYLEEFLEVLDDEPRFAFQSTVLPSILCRIYKTLVACELDKDLSENIRSKYPDFLGENQDKDIELRDISALDKELASEDEQDVTNEIISNNDEKDPKGNEDDDNMDFDSEGMSSGTDDEECLKDEEEDEDEDDHDIDDYYSSDQSSDSELFGTKEEKSLYQQMMTRPKFNLSEPSDTLERIKPWDMRGYERGSSETIKLELETSNNYTSNVYQTCDEYHQIFSGLPLKIDPHLEDLLNHLKKFEFEALGEKWDTNEDEEFKKRSAHVDLNLAPLVKYDKFDVPLGLGSQTDLGLIEAITFRAAQESFDLEFLENLGDSFLKYLISIVLYRLFEKTTEGVLTAARSELVCNKNFTYLAKRKGLGSYAIKSPFTKNLFCRMIGRDPRDENEAKTFQTKLKSKDLADIFEAIVGYYIAQKGQFSAIMAIDWLGLHVVRSEVFSDLGQPTMTIRPFPTSFLTGLDPENLLHAQECAIKSERFEDTIGYHFKDKSYLIQALTHSSYIRRSTQSYERLEYLGDAILDFLVTSTLYSSDIKRTPGQMTTSRSALVNNHAFARLAIIYKFDLFIFFFNQDLHDDLARVRLVAEEDPEANYIEMVDFDSVAKLLADVFESVAGAIYLDSGCSLDTVWRSYYPMMKKNIDKEIKEPTKNLTMGLYETFPGRDRISFESMDEKGDKDKLRKRVRLNIEGFKTFDGIGSTKRQAKLRAVQEAMKNLPLPEEIERLNEEYKKLHPQHSNAKPRPTNRGQRGRFRGGRNFRRPRSSNYRR